MALPKHHNANTDGNRQVQLIVILLLLIMLVYWLGWKSPAATRPSHVKVEMTDTPVKEKSK